jgi:predicted transposase YbfD/YdcC
VLIWGLSKSPDRQRYPVPACSSSLPVLSDAEWIAELPGGELSLADSVRLLEALGAVPDPRKRRGRRHCLRWVLLLAVGAVMAGRTSLVAMASWAARADHKLAPAGPTPSPSTFARVLAAVDPAALQHAIDTWLARRLGAQPPTAQPSCTRSGQDERRAVAVDGKVLRGARQPDGQVKLVAAYDHDAGLVLGQVPVVGGDEIAALPEVLGCLSDLARSVVTADALHCQDAHANWIVGAGAHFVLTVKGNRPRLRRALAAQPWGPVPGLRYTETGHGRTETRSIKVISTDGQPGLQALFPHATQIAKVNRSRKRTGKQRSQETVYIVTSLNHQQATPAQLAAYVRGQWSIENGLHWVRDVTQREDASQVRTGHAPQNLAALRNLAINLFRLDGRNNIAAAHRHYADQPHLIGPVLAAA